MGLFYSRPPPCSLLPAPAFLLPTTRPSFSRLFFSARRALFSPCSLLPTPAFLLRPPLTQKRKKGRARLPSPRHSPFSFPPFLLRPPLTPKSKRAHRPSATPEHTAPKKEKRRAAFPARPETISEKESPFSARARPPPCSLFPAPAFLLRHSPFFFPPFLLRPPLTPKKKKGAPPVCHPGTHRTQKKKKRARPPSFAPPLALLFPPFLLRPPLTPKSKRAHRPSATPEHTALKKRKKGRARFPSPRHSLFFFRLFFFARPGRKPYQKRKAPSPPAPASRKGVSKKKGGTVFTVPPGIQYKGFRVFLTEPEPVSERSAPRETR